MDFFDIWMIGVAPIFVSAAFYAGTKNAHNRIDHTNVAGQIAVSVMMAVLWPLCAAALVLYFPYYVGEQLKLQIEDVKTHRRIKAKLERIEQARLEERAQEHLPEVNELLARQRGDVEVSSDEVKQK